VHRRLAYLLAWVVAAAVTVSIAWLGIRSVLAAAAPTRTVPLSAVGLRKAAPLPTSTQSPQSGQSRPAGTGGQVTGPNEPWVRDGETFKRSFHVAGGDVSFFTTKDQVQVASSVAKTGYTVNVNRYAGDSVMVSFFGDRQTSRVWVRWWNGPYAEVTESVN
jgi:hypothetical protein